MNLFVCECFEKKYPTITLIDCFGLKLEGQYLKIFYQDDLFICCVQMVNFCYKVNRWYYGTMERVQYHLIYFHVMFL